MADRVGQRFGNYRLVRLIGRGGFADVYLGEHIYLKTEAAIKILHTRLTEKEVEKFLAEARTVARLRHAHIVRVLDFGVQDETPFLVMDYARNGSLRRNHPEGTTLPLATIVSYIMQVAEALQYAHDEKLIHRDIKPENIFLGDHNEILLGDFGLVVTSRSGLTLPTPQGVAGTPYYMAPEQFLGHPSRSSDQYALGVIVYEWLCGDRPFDGALIELMGQHLHASPPPLREKMPTLSQAVEQVVMKALAKDPKARYANVREYAQALYAAWKQISKIEEGDAHYEAGQYKEAIAAYDRALVLAPDNAEVYNKRGIAYGRLEEYRKAIADFDRALELDSKSSFAYAGRGATYGMVDEYQRAIQDCSRALELDSKSALAYRSRGAAYYMVDEYQRAIQDCTRALELDSMSVGAYAVRGHTYVDLKDYQQAIQDFDRALELDPNNDWAKDGREQVYRQLKKPKWMRALGL